MRIHSLTIRFVLTLLLSTVVPFLVFTGIARAYVREGQSDVVDEALRAEAESVAGSLTKALQGFHGECSWFRSFAVRALGGELSIDEFEQELLLSGAFQDDYHLAVLTDATGRVVAVVDGLGDGPTLTSRAAFRPRTAAGQPWFDALLDGEGMPIGGQVWLDRHLSPFMHRDPGKPSSDPADYAYGLAFLVQGDTEVLGSMLALRRWGTVQDELDRSVDRLRSQWPSAAASLWGPDGVTFAHTDRERYGSPAESDDAVLEPNAASAVRFECDGSPHRAGIARIGRIADPIDWRFGVRASEADLFLQARQLSQVLLLVTAAIGAILLVWAWFASRAILRPVRRLATATERVAAGDFEARVPTPGRDELADLGRAFNDMAGEVAASREQLRSAERQAAWAEMARQVAHEIKNPLTPMRMSAQLLLRANREQDPRLPELVDRLARTVAEQTDALARIASDFRQFAGEPARQLAPIAASALLEDVAGDFAATVESGVALTFEDASEGTSVEVDRQEIRRVFLNLVQNALDATGVDGHVRVVARREGARVAFSIHDDGPGIEAEVRDRLFEPYFTTRSAGTGLGLAICRRIVEAHGGTIELAASEPGVTEFCFRLPLAASGDSAATTE